MQETAEVDPPAPEAADQAEPAQAEEMAAAEAPAPDGGANDAGAA